MFAATAALLFLLPFLSFDPGEMGLFSPPLLPFLAGSSGMSVLIGGAGGFTEVGGLATDGAGASRDFCRMNAPGSPTRGFSSIYS